MRNIILPISVIAFLFVGCHNKNAEEGKKTVSRTSEQPWEVADSDQNFIVDSIQYEDSVKIDNQLTARYTRNWLVFPSIKNKAVLDSIYGEKLTGYTKEDLKTFFDNDKQKYFEQVKKDNGEYPITYEQTQFTEDKMKVVSHNKDFLQISSLNAFYQGGAHDNYGTSYMVIDLQNNKKMQLSDITTISENQLAKLLQKNIDKIHSGTSDAEGPVANSEMLLEKNFKPNHNFYFDEQNLYFSYVPYEIAAFAAGQITIPVSWAALKGTLAPDFAKRMNLQ